MSSCTHGVLFSRFENTPHEGWHADSALHFSIGISDSLPPCDLVFDIRHNEQYPYQNIWLLTDLYADSAFVLTDTLEYYLANQRGEWLGNGFGRLKDMPALWLNNTVLPHADTIHIYVRHGMRTDTLRGVESIGLTLNTHVEQGN